MLSVVRNKRNICERICHILRQHFGGLHYDVQCVYNVQKRKRAWFGMHVLCSRLYIGLDIHDPAVLCLKSADFS